MSNKIVDKVCTICDGNKTICRNFGAITCDSCKSFFRRTALITRPLICPSDGKCNITTATRKCCQKCRLNKCFAVGMKKEFIRDVEANELRKQLIKENKHKSQQNNENNSVDKPIDNSVDNVINDTSNETKLSDETYAQEIETYAQEIEALIEDSLNISDEALSEQIMEIESYVIKDTNVEKVAQNTNPLAVIPIFKEITDYNGINHLESNRISELLSASNVINYPFSSNITEITDYDLFVRLMAPGSDTYDEHTTICFPIEVVKHRNMEIFNKTKPIVDRLLTEWQHDSVIMELLTAIIIFNPNAPNVT
ncbi:unnamed protein product, partial [Oppiella nova]